MLKNHVTLNGYTMYYNSNTIVLNNVVVYTGVVTMAVLAKIANA